jgi:hypothetical protein
VDITCWGTQIIGVEGGRRSRLQNVGNSICIAYAFVFKIMDFVNEISYPPSTPIICVPQHVITTKQQVKGQILLNIPIVAPQFIRAPDDGQIEPETCRTKFE